MNNIVKIELFDAETGVKQFETKKHNYVTEGFLKYIDLWARQLLYSGVAFGSSYTPTVSTALNRYLLLTNNSDAVDTTDGVFNDTVVAFADLYSAYSGTNPPQGTINVTETSLDSTEMVLVCDFATDKGNGTFQSVHLSSSQSFPIAYNNSLSVSSHIEITGNGPICSDSTYFYIWYSTTKVARINKSTLAYVDDIILSAGLNPIDIATDGTSLFLGTANDLYKSDMSGNLTLLTTSSVRGVTVIGTTLYSAIGSNVYSSDLNYTTPVLEFSLATTINYMANDGTDLYIKESQIYKYATSGTLLATIGEPTISYSGIEYKDANTLYVSADGIAEMDLTTPFNAVTRARLDTPVTKTSAQTMKITYTFNTPS